MAVSTRYSQWLTMRHQQWFAHGHQWRGFSCSCWLANTYRCIVPWLVPCSNCWAANDLLHNLDMWIVSQGMDPWNDLTSTTLNPRCGNTHGPWQVTANPHAARTAVGKTGWTCATCPWSPAAQPCHRHGIGATTGSGWCDMVTDSDWTKKAVENADVRKKNTKKLVEKWELAGWATPKNA